MDSTTTYFFLLILPLSKIALEYDFFGQIKYLFLNTKHTIFAMNYLSLSSICHDFSLNVVIPLFKTWLESFENKSLIENNNNNHKYGLQYSKFEQRKYYTFKHYTLIVLGKAKPQLPLSFHLPISSYTVVDQIPHHSFLYVQKAVWNGLHSIWLLHSCWTFLPCNIT